MRYYIALLHKEPKSDYGASFPDLPGCITAGRTLDEARTMAVEALALHLQGLSRHRWKRSWPIRTTAMASPP
jgi:predicted RNase H-like HicB family nuclease